MHALHLLLSTSREVSTETRNWNTFQLRRRNDVHITRRITGAKRKWWGKGNAERRKEQRNGWNEVGKWLQLNQKIYHEYATSETVPRTFLFFRICLAKIKILLTFASLTASVFWCAKGHQCEQGFFFSFSRPKRTNCNYRSFHTIRLCLSEQKSWDKAIIIFM